MSIKFYHNPRCSKSRQALALLQKEGVQLQIIEYLKHPPNFETLSEIIRKLNCKPIDIMRTKESVFRDLSLNSAKKDEELIQSIIEYPILIERPIVVSKTKAILGRPPENVLTIL